MKKLLTGLAITLALAQPALADYWRADITTDVYTEKEAASMVVVSNDGTSLLSFSCDGADKVTVSFGQRLNVLYAASVDEALAVAPQEIALTIKSPYEGLKTTTASIGKWNTNFVAWSTQDYEVIQYWVATVKNAQKPILVGANGMTVAFPYSGSTNAMVKFGKVCGILWE
jgi:hypothetical protein